MAAVAKKAMKQDNFYQDAAKYWETITPSVDGMLGGYGHISSVDIGLFQIIHTPPLWMTPDVQTNITIFCRGYPDKNEMILKIIQGIIRDIQCDWDDRVPNERALDCGAGIGRVSKHLLLPLFQQVDLVEQNQIFIDAAPKHLGESSKNVGNYFCKGLHEFVPQTGWYDVIWIQWVLGHLTDDHFVQFFKRCKKGLTEYGMIFVKENIAKEGVIFDEQDSSVTRSSTELKRLFVKAGVTIIKEVTQTDFPMELYCVKMYALR